MRKFLIGGIAIAAILATTAAGYRDLIRSTYWLSACAPGRSSIELGPSKMTRSVDRSGAWTSDYERASLMGFTEVPVGDLGEPTCQVDG